MGRSRAAGVGVSLLGHIQQSRTVRESFESGKMHHAWLLAGPRGVGKATFAHAVAAWVLARAAKPAGTSADTLAVDAEHSTMRLIAAGSHLDLRTVAIQTNPKTGKPRPGIAVDQFVKTDTSIGEPLGSIFRTTPALSDWRVIVIDAVDDLNRNAANAFLKNLEEPPAKTLFLAVCHSPGRLLPTIRSRCRVLRFHALDESDVDAVLSARFPDMPAVERSALVRIAGGKPGRVAQLSGSNIESLVADLDGLAAAPAAEATGRALTLARSVASVAAFARYEALLDLAPAYLADAARDRRGARLAHAIGLWERAYRLGGSALALSLDPQGVAFELAGLVAELATSSPETAARS